MVRVESSTLAKTCIRCGETKPLDAFFSRPKPATGGYRGHCKACHNRSRSSWRPPKWKAKGIGIGQRDGSSMGYVDLRDYLGEPSICYLCGDSLTWGTAAIDHVVPLSQGGANAIENLQWAHRVCNLVKGALLLEDLCVLARKILDRHATGREHPSLDVYHGARYQEGAHDNQNLS